MSASGTGHDPVAGAGGSGSKGVPIPADELTVKLKKVQYTKVMLLQQLQDAESACAAAGSREKRNAAHIIRREASANYEDFIYYQNDMHRFNNMEHMPKEKKNAEWLFNRKARRVKRTERLMELETPFADAAVKENAKNPRIKFGELDATKKLVLSSQQLHWWTPPPRRWPGGFGRPPISNQQIVGIDVDLEELEARRAKIEDASGGMAHSQVGNAKVPSIFPNHTERRRNDMREEKGNPAFLVRQCHGDLRIHISALERSDDWPTSYDCAGIVKRGFSKTVADAHARGELDPTNPDKEQRNRENEKYKHHFTEWAEETDGRRELHAHGMLAPSSPVDSPPHSPIIPPDGLETHGWDVPIDFPYDYEHIATWIDYRRKFGDHYGSNDEHWPHYEKKGRGVRFPHAPLDLALPLDGEAPKHVEASTVAGTGLLREPAPDGYAMQMYREVVQEADGDGMDGSEVAVSTSKDISPEEPEDFEDLFTISYQQGLAAIAAVGASSS